ncbi:outer membrane protein assembly factor BamA [Aquimarina sp. 2201CG14-23]|uniref:outer membrane protein assembly factor BamA n=1 Tax=Aquimarina mycalae TaxID=3040073 RepID=UPI0024780B33|nr:outer membrane protein assembly factor BamA [Aquimarina sp. 2201CG14-23]MDH7445334.1 outer membrane protein assembly factor BamA [Aquimarina sp. 2201CG14-23]
MTKKLPITYLAFIAFLINTVLLSAQSIPGANGKEYIIGDIEVTGITTYSKNTVITFTGLKKGERILLPGDRISQIIKKLWGLELFSDINFYITKVEGDIAHLEINIQEVPELNQARIEGVKKRKAEDLVKDNSLNPGSKVTENLITTTRNFITNKYRKDGFLNTKVIINTTPVKDTVPTNKVNMLVRIDKGDRVKVDKIEIQGNTQFSDNKVRSSMKNTKRRKFWRIWKRSKYIKSDYQEDKESIISKYKEKGYRDARIVSDSLIVEDDNSVSLSLNIEEGNKYYFGDIKFLGNSVYTDRQLARQLVIKKGDVYNGVLLEKQIADNTKPDANDLTNLYQNNGYLFSNIDPVETNVKNDTIDFEIRIREGKLVHFDHITVTGNDKTNDHVVYRILRTKPGQVYSKDLVVRTVREIGQLGFFDPEQLEPQFKNANPQAGTIDINYPVVEKGASQIELQGGFGGGGFVGTLGLAFSNFSIRNIFNKEAYSPLPMGDGQTLRVRAQASQFFQTYSLSFVEPWLGGKRPFQLSTSFSHTIQFLFNQRTRDVDRDSKFLITGGSIGIAKRLNWPDNYFTLSQAVSIQHYNLKNYNTRLFTFGDGSSNNLAYTIGINRNNTAINPIFPTSGSEFNLVAKLSLPYSIWDGTDYSELAQERSDLLAEQENLVNTDPTNSRIGEISTEIGEIDQERFDWLEYYKIKFDATWYTTLAKIGKQPLVLRTRAEYGFLGAYNNDRGNIPFERFFLGGDGLGATSLDGREVVALRGYENQSLIPLSRANDPDFVEDGATIYNKYSLELRYPITLKPSASIYMLAFLEGGASYDSFRGFNPFQLNRSAGAGLRIFMPAFGLLGIDFGYGFDPIPGTTGSNGWETHFIIGQQF